MSLDKPLTFGKKLMQVSVIDDKGNKITGYIYILNS